MKQNFHEEEIKINGMHCKSCTEKIGSRLSQLEGVEKARISLAEEKVYVRFDPTKTSAEKIRKEIEDMVYGAGSSGNASGSKPGKSSIKQGILYGLVPHIGCIAFIIGSVLGVTVLTQFFRPLLMNPYFFHILVLLSVGFATLSSALYLRSNGLLSTQGVRKKWKYLSSMYGSTVGINLLLFLVVFPLLANVSFAQATTGNLVGASNGVVLYSMRMQVDIPCSGHASLISGDLKALSGVSDVQFSLPNVFDVKYDSAKVTKQQILGLEVFKTYRAAVLDESETQINAASSVKSLVGSSGGGCCGGNGTCGGTCGSK